MSLSDCVIFPGEGDRSAAVKMLPQIATRTRVIPNAVAAPPVTGHKPERAVRCFAGRFAGLKGLRFLRKSFPYACQARCATHKRGRAR